MSSYHDVHVKVGPKSRDYSSVTRENDDLFILRRSFHFFFFLAKSNGGIRLHVFFVLRGVTSTRVDDVNVVKFFRGYRSSSRKEGLKFIDPDWACLSMVREKENRQICHSGLLEAAEFVSNEGFFTTRGP